MDRRDDRHEIEQQMFRYARATDWLQTQDHRQVFADDCVFATPHSGDLFGPDAVVDYMDRVLPQFEATQHLIGNIAIEFTGDDTATAVSYVRAWHRYPDPQKPDLVLWGEYHDRWERIDGTWRIRERRVLEAGIEPRREGGVPNPRRASR
jgi:3-phenylpropionate/cinnamic acid dioxygenase small subunit